MIYSVLLWYLFKKTQVQSFFYLEHDLESIGDFNFEFSLSLIGVELDDEIEQERSFDWNKCGKGFK